MTNVPQPARPAPAPAAGHATPMALNEHQVRRILATFSHVDDLLKQVEALTQPDPSPFGRERPDVSPEEAGLLLAFANVARKRMIAALDRLGIPRPEQTLSARHSVGVSLLYAEIALSELDARSLRGYGAIDAAAAAEVTALASDLQGLMRRGISLLKEQDEGGLVDRLDALAGAPGEILRRLLRISTRHGLTEIRPLIAAAAERAGSTTLDVGVFGRVSAGKSSLINALVGVPVLPVGATPVTAVPLRIGRGDEAVEIRFRDGRVERVARERLPEFATEEKNPQNRLGVRSIEVSLREAPEGLRFLDTPGVGSLTSSGSAQAFAWLPRCDLGLVLVAAGTPVGRDETALVSGLRHAGIDCRVLLSKADLLEPSDAGRALDYITAELRPLVGLEEPLDVRAVSTRAGLTSGFERLQTEVLRPLADDHSRRALEALRSRLRRLIALAAAGMDGGAPPELDDSKVELEKRRTAANAGIGRTTDRLASSAKRALEEVAEAVAAAWSRGEDGAAPARAAIMASASRGLSEVRGLVDGVRVVAGGSEDAGRRRLPPLFDPEFLDAIKRLPPPWIAPGFARLSMARHAVAPLLPYLDDALHRYSSRLRTWGEAAIEEVRAGGSVAAGGSATVRHAELALLEALVAEIGGAATPSASVVGPAHHS